MTTFPMASSVFKSSKRAVNGSIELMADPSSGMVDKAVVVLSNLASVPDGKNAIVEEGGIPVLVEDLRAMKNRLESSGTTDDGSG